MARSRTAVLAGVFFVVALLAWPAVSQAYVIDLVSLTDSEGLGNGDSSLPAISSDARYVAFMSDATTLVSGDTNGMADIFVRDRVDRTTRRVSVATGGAQANGSSVGSDISADGRYVAFESLATNLVGGVDTNDDYDVFVHDRLSGTTVQVSVSTAGVKGNGRSTLCSISADGRYVAFSSTAANLVAGDTNFVEDVFVRDLVANTTVRVSVASDGSQGRAKSFYGSLSGDGQYIAFESFADDLVPGDTTYLKGDIFVHDLFTGATKRVSVSSAGVEADNWCSTPAISADGRYVTFESTADNLVGGDTNGQGDIFVHDQATGTTSRVSVSTGGAQANGQSLESKLSEDGRFVVFWSEATTLVSGDTNGVKDIFLRDRTTGITSRVSVDAAGNQGNGESLSPCISDDGRYIGLFSAATNLVPGDTNGFQDVFVRINSASIVYTSLRGTDRYDTAIKLSKVMFPWGLPPNSGVVLAPGETFPEALCGAPLASAYGGPVLLTPTAGLNNAVKAEILRLNPDYVICIGLSDSIKNAAQTALGGTGTASVIRGTGGSVYDMSYKVAKALATRVGSLGNAVAIITRGDVFPDAIGVSPLACGMRWPILLTGSGPILNSSAANALGELGIHNVLKVGTYTTLPVGVAGVANLSGADRYVTNSNVATWGETFVGQQFRHIGIATGEKFPDALAAGPYLAVDAGVLLLSPLAGPVPVSIAAQIAGHAAEVYHVSFIAMIEPVISQVKALLP